MFILFLALMSLDIFEGDYGFWGTSQRCTKFLSFGEYNTTIQKARFAFSNFQLRWELLLTAMLDNIQ